MPWGVLMLVERVAELFFSIYLISLHDNQVYRLSAG